MKKFVFLYWANPESPQTEETEKSMKAWGEWLGKLQEQGKVADAGNPFATGRLVAKDSVQAQGVRLPDGTAIVGYTIISAGDLDQAIEIAKSCPFAGDLAIEVNECMDM